MATSGMPQPSPDQSAGASPSGAGAGAPPPPQGGAQPPSQGQASKLQELLAGWANVAKQMSASDPRLASGAEKVSQGILEMQTALVTPPQPTPTAQQPSYA